MNLINEEITHKVFGAGNIVEQDESVITVDFNQEIKKFVYPDSIGKFIKLNDPHTAKSFKKLISKRKIEEQALEREREELNEQLALEQRRREKMKKHKIHESSQVVFWLDEDEQQSVFTDWQVSTGKVQSGQNKGQPNRAARLSTNSACLLTAREPDQPEQERRILGLYMVTDAFTGELSEDGKVLPHAQFRIKLTEQESANMLFWNYYVNKNFPHQITWNSGKFRYYNNVWTAQILKDIISIKTDEEDIKRAESFLEYFCKLNLLEIEQIEKANGALLI